jgi:3-oxoacyl-[acyl-carrier protein] reductase
MHVGSTELFGQIDPNDFAKASYSLLCAFQKICHATRPHLAKQGGAIVGLVSDAGRFAAPHQSVMGTAFGGMITFARNVSTEISHEGIRIHMISLSYVAETRVYEQSRSGRAEAAAKRAGLGLPRPQDIAPLALFLCGPDSAKMTGQVISINGGLTV